MNAETMTTQPLHFFTIREADGDNKPSHIAKHLPPSGVPIVIMADNYTEVVGGVIHKDDGTLVFWHENKQGVIDTRRVYQIEYEGRKYTPTQDFYAIGTTNYFPTVILPEGQKGTMPSPADEG